MKLLPVLTWVMVLPAIGVPAVITATGTRLCVVELFPSSPRPLPPQQYTRPAESTAHTKPTPVLTWTMVLPAMGVPAVVTATGTLLCTVELFPSSTVAAPPPAVDQACRIHRTRGSDCRR